MKMRETGGVTPPPFGVQFSKKYSRTAPNELGGGSMYDYQISLDQRVDPTYPATALRSMRLNPKLMQPVKTNVEELREVRVEQKADALKHEIFNQKKDKIDKLSEDLVNSMKSDKGIKRKHMLQALNSVSILNSA